jgi:hypothetical protein
VELLPLNMNDSLTVGIAEKLYHDLKEKGMAVHT